MTNPAWAELYSELDAKREIAQQHGGEDAVSKAHARGKLTARERIGALLDPGTFQEIGLHVEAKVKRRGRPDLSVKNDAVIAGWGRVDGRQVIIVADDGTVMGGAASILNVEKRFRARRIAVEQGLPFISLLEGSAIRFQDSMDAAILSRVPAFREVAECQGKIPQVSAVLGPCYGRPPIDVLCSDFAVMARGTGFLGLSGPALVQGGIGQQSDINQLSGPEMQADTNGLIDRVEDSEIHCIEAVRQFLSYMPSNAYSHAPVADAIEGAARQIEDIVPVDSRKPYNVKDVLDVLFDSGSLFEYKPSFGQSIVTALARLEGKVVGIIANQPMKRGGVLDWAASMKGRRFLNVCNHFNIPLVLLQDQPGFLPGVQSESENILYWAGTFLLSMERATVPKISIIMRKCHGAAMWAMGVNGSPDVAGNLVAAWPTAIMTGTGPASAVFTVHAQELKEASDPRALQKELEANYAREGSSYRAAEAFGIDDIIKPSETRRWLSNVINLVSNKSARGLAPKAPLFP